VSVGISPHDSDRILSRSCRDDSSTSARGVRARDARGGVGEAGLSGGVAVASGRFEGAFGFGVAAYTLPGINKRCRSFKMVL